MFSEALRIMDRNTTKYMIDELKQRAEEAEQKAEEAEQKAEQMAEQKAEQMVEKKLIDKICRKLRRGMDDKSIACELEEEISVISRITSVARKMNLTMMSRKYIQSSSGHKHGFSGRGFQFSIFQCIVPVLSLLIFFKRTGDTDRLTFLRIIIRIYIVFGHFKFQSLGAAGGGVLYDAGIDAFAVVLL